MVDKSVLNFTQFSEMHDKATITALLCILDYRLRNNFVFYRDNLGHLLDMSKNPNIIVNQTLHEIYVEVGCYILNIKRLITRPGTATTGASEKMPLSKALQTKFD